MHWTKQATSKLNYVTVLCAQLQQKQIKHISYHKTHNFKNSNNIQAMHGSESDIQIWWKMSHEGAARVRHFQPRVIC